MPSIQKSVLFRNSFEWLNGGFYGFVVFFSFFSFLGHLVLCKCSWIWLSSSICSQDNISEWLSCFFVLLFLHEVGVIEVDFWKRLKLVRRIQKRGFEEFKKNSDPFHSVQRGLIPPLKKHPPFIDPHLQKSAIPPYFLQISNWHSILLHKGKISLARS